MREILYCIYSTKTKLLLFSVILLLISFNKASACVCTGEVSTVPQSFKNADVVFSGKIIKNMSSKVLFKVERFWKGVSTNTIYILNGNTSCSPNFKKDGKQWLIYASKTQLYKDEEGKIPAGIFLDSDIPCGRSKELVHAKTDLVELGLGKVPIKSRYLFPLG